MASDSDATSEIARLEAERDVYRAANLATNSQNAYGDSWKRFESWCASMGLDSLPASGETVALWATAMLEKGKRITSVEARLSGVANAHYKAGFASPLGHETRSVLHGARRLRHENPRQKRALTVQQLWKICRTMDLKTIRGVRDRAIIVLGFAGGFRRSEIAGLELADVSFVPKGVLIHLKWTKTDQEGRGRDVPIFRGRCADTCPVRTLAAWIDVRGTAPGPLFRQVGRYERLSDQGLGADGIVCAIKRAVAAIGLDPHQYAGHSLRS